MSRSPRMSRLLAFAIAVSSSTGVLAVATPAYAVSTPDVIATAKDEVGRSHIQCTAQVVEFNFLCDGAFVFDNGSQLHASVALDFSMEEGMETFDIAVTGGTGDWFGATGAISVTDISTAAETASLYEADVVLP